MASRLLCIELCAGGISGEAWEKRAGALDRLPAARSSQT